MIVFMIIWLFLPFSIIQESKYTPLSVKVISTQKGKKVFARVLLKFPIDTLPGEILTAILEFPSELQTELSDYHFLEIAPLKTAWDTSTVSWTHPWSCEGGDFRKDFAKIIPLESGSRNLVDITGFFKNKETDFKNGFIIMPSEFEGKAFDIKVEKLKFLFKNLVLHVYFLKNER